MKTQFKLGQVVRFKNYRRNNDEKEAYFVVIQEEDVANEMVLYTINSNRIYISGTTIIPEFPEEDLRIVTLRPSDLLVSNVEFEFNSTIKHRLKGNLYIDRNYKNNNQS